MPARRGTATRPEDLGFAWRRSEEPDYAPLQRPAQDARARHVTVVSIASTLLAVCFVVITGLIYTHMSDDTLADEIAWFAVAFFLGTIVMSFMALRQAVGSWRSVWTDRLLLIGLAILTVSIAVIGIDLH